ncbi:MAG: PD40 domain-containing protein [Deltaproteobacteria bacterium]|nr:PD40 domain-containing protein [Deltaproteobacteria bacterium]
MIELFKIWLSILLGGCLIFGCTSYPTNSQDDKPKEIPFACTQAFTDGLADSIKISDTQQFRYIEFSEDCKKILTIDNTLQRLRVTDLESNTTIELNNNVDLARFGRDSNQVIIRILPEGKAYNQFELYLAQEDQVHLIDTNVLDSFQLSQDGSWLAYRKNYVNETYSSDLVLVSLDQIPLNPKTLASGVPGQPSFTNDSQKIAYLSNRQARHYESVNHTCDWHDFDLYLYDMATSQSELLGQGVTSYAVKMSADNLHILASADYDCENQSRTMTSFSLNGEDPQALVKKTSTFFDLDDVVEFIEEKKIMHIAVHFPTDPGEIQSELWITNMDGSGSEVVAQNVMSHMQSCAYFISFMLAADNTIVYTQRETLDIIALDLDTQQSWRLLESPESLYFSASPDGSSIISLYGHEGRVDLVVTNINSAESKTLLADMFDPGRFEWCASGKRLIYQESPHIIMDKHFVYSIDPASGQNQVLADDVAQGAYAKLHPGGWLVAVPREDGLYLMKVL